ncbi:MAG: SDR family NAD(P)-dependent oxidoreductase [Chloroflexota bacterium]
MTNLYVLLTGGHTGLGLGVTKKLLKVGNKIGLIVRSESRKNQTIGEFSDFPKELVDNIDFFYADLSDQAQVKRVAAEISEKWPRIDRLFNNAAVVGGPEKGRNMSKQGNEWHYEINTLAPYILTTELKPLLENSEAAVVITTVTGGMHSRALSTDQIFDEKNGATMSLYAQSKTAIMLLLNDFADQWDGVKFVTVNPGANKTKMTQSGSTPWIIRNVLSLFFNDPSVGTQRIYNGGFDSKIKENNPIYLDRDKIREIQVDLSAAQKTQLLSGLKI